MTQSLPPPHTIADSGNRAVFRRAARLAQRLFCRSSVARRHCVTTIIRRAGLGAVSGAQTAATRTDDVGAPWHDQTMPLAERMKLAEGKPLRWRMMAAMAQQDCGQCGYDCKDYAGAFFRQGGAAEPLRAGRQGNRPHAQGAVRGDRARAGWPAASAPDCRHRRKPQTRRLLARQSRRGNTSYRARGSTSRVRRKRPGTSNSICPKRARLLGRRRLRALSGK